MKYCTMCGKEMPDDAEYCPSCGHKMEPTDRSSLNDTLRTIAKVFMVIATVISGFALIPLAWMIPMTVVYFSKVKNKEKISLAFKICALLFASKVAGILMLCDDEL